MSHQFTAAEEQVLGRLFVEHVRNQTSDACTFFDVFNHMARLDQTVAVEAAAAAADEFDKIVADVSTPSVVEFGEGLTLIADYLSHGGVVADVEKWLGIPTDNALDVLAFAADDESDTETMLAWGAADWSEVESLIVEAMRRHDGYTDIGYWHAHTAIMDDMEVSDETAELILGWYGWALMS